MDLKNEFWVQTNLLKSSIVSKFEDNYHRLNTSEKYLQSNITAVVNESIMNIKDSIIQALREENQNLQNKVKEVEETLILVGMLKINIDQYNRWNNVEIQGVVKL